MHSKIAVCWLLVCLFAQLGAFFDRLPLVWCPLWGARPQSTLTQPFLLQLVMSTIAPFVSVYLASFLPSITHTWAPCLDCSFSTLALLFVWVWRGSIFYCFPSLFSLLIIFSFSLCSVRFIFISCVHFLLQALIHCLPERRIFSNCCIIQENSVAVFFDQDK